MAVLISIVGPTAVGKTQLAIQLAQKYQTEIISCDSRQIYSDLSIGTAKPSLEERTGVMHHLMDFLTLDQTYSAGQFERDAQELIAQIFQSRSVAVAAGGSTLYFEALWYGMNEMPKIPPEFRQKLILEWEEKGLNPLLEELKEHDPTTYLHIDRNNPVRIIRALEVWRGSQKPLSYFHEKSKKKKHKSSSYKHVKVGLYRERGQLYKRINDRVDQMIEEGFDVEVKSILEAGFDSSLQSLQSIGYKEWIDYFQGKVDREETIRLIKRNSRRYAKRQLTYFKRFQDIHWFDATKPVEVLNWVQKEINSGK